LDSKADKDFQDLSEFLKDSNRAAAMRMVEILSLAGLRLAPRTTTPDEEQNEQQLIRQHLEYRLEALAEAEHDGWMAWHLARGWRYAPKKDPERQLHPCLRPFGQLQKVETDKDRDSVRHYPDFARKAGLRIEFANPS
jgi:hypothetical protein